MLHLQNVTKDYVTSSETVRALKGINISFREKEFVSVLGPSGCGKTTLLNIIGGLDHYTSGDLIINGRSTKSYKDRDWDVYRNHRVGFIFQSYNLIPHQNVLANVELALTIAGISKEERVARAKAALDKVGLEGQYYKKPNQLSGGQCQRVAIARALVNNPEILLADEPTGALDTVTSVQIMDLIREIAGERLVIMVTHNPELAEQYSTRIVRLLDGLVVEDSNPMSESERIEEAERIRQRDTELAKAQEAQLSLNTETAHVSPEAKTEREAERKKPKKEKAKMSFFTAFRLSFKNLLSKKGRTAMVGIAGSIGIFGIAIVLAFSTGIRAYVASMQDDMLSGNPILIEENTYDLDALSGMMSLSQKGDVIKHPNRVYVNELVKYLAQMNTSMQNFMVKNEITEEYIEYVKAMSKETYAAMVFGYGIDLSFNLYTEFSVDGTEDMDRMASILAITNNYTSILENTDLKQYASYVEQVVPSFSQAPNSEDYIRTQYKVHGKVATGKNEIMLVLDKDERLADVLLARLGYYTQREFENIIYCATDKTGTEDGFYPTYFSYDDLMGKKFYWYPNDTVFTKGTGAPTFTPSGDVIMNTFDYSPEADENWQGLELEVVGILIPNETTSFGCLRSGIYYTEELTNYILDMNEDSEDSGIVGHIRENGNIDSAKVSGTQIGNPMISNAYVGVHYVFDVYFDENRDGEVSSEEIIHTVKPVGKSPDMADMMEDFFGSGGEDEDVSTQLTADETSGDGAGNAGGMGGLDIQAMLASMKSIDERMLGGNRVANRIAIYPTDFTAKNAVTSYLDAWNNGAEEGGYEEIQYTDTLELVINLINGMIDIVTYALVAFTSISLVVSTVMIGIITYVSVVERIKEIGVIRSLGGRKKDVSHLFNAETFIIGLLAGLIGIGGTYLISILANLILESLTGIPTLVMLKASHAVILVSLSVVLTLVSGLIPARSAAKKDPIEALRVQ